VFSFRLTQYLKETTDEARPRRDFLRHLPPFLLSFPCSHCRAPRRDF
jgi:hypothetical protein